MNILEELAQSNRELVENQKKLIPINEIINQAELVREHPSFKEALKQPGISFICELKKASPSKGLICSDFNYLKFAHEYEDNNVSAISCLTEPTKFLGSLEILKDVANHSSLYY